MCQRNLLNCYSGSYVSGPTVTIFLNPAAFTAPVKLRFSADAGGIKRRDRVVGLLTERSAKTLLFYLQETNLNLYYWLTAFMQAYPIPRVRPSCALAQLSLASLRDCSHGALLNGYLWHTSIVSTVLSTICLQAGRRMG